jgi:hypothetical protein
VKRFKALSIGHRQGGPRDETQHFNRILSWMPPRGFSHYWPRGTMLGNVVSCQRRGVLRIAQRRIPAWMAAEGEFEKRPPPKR